MGRLSRIGAQFVIVIFPLLLFLTFIGSQFDMVDWGLVIVILIPGLIFWPAAGLYYLNHSAGHRARIGRRGIRYYNGDSQAWKLEWKRCSKIVMGRMRRGGFRGGVFLSFHVDNPLASIRRDISMGDSEKYRIWNHIKKLQRKRIHDIEMVDEV